MTNTNQSNQECLKCGSKIKGNSNSNYVYRVQVGVFRNYDKALRLQMQLLQLGCPTQIVRQGELHGVHVGEYETLDEAVILERALRKYGFATLLVAV